MPTKFADEGFVVLVRIPIERGPAQRETYVVGCATQEECEIKIRQMYASNKNAEFFISPMSPATIKRLRLMPGEVRPWL
jgi:hypothetical protein